MPSPRQILTDITDHGLDPSKAYTKTSTVGNLRPQEINQKVEEQEAPKSLDKTVKYALIEVPVVEPVVVEEPKKKEKEKKQKKLTEQMSGEKSETVVESNSSTEPEASS